MDRYVRFPIPSFHFRKRNRQMDGKTNKKIDGYFDGEMVMKKYTYRQRQYEKKPEKKEIENQ